MLEALRFLPGTSVSGRVRARSVLELSWSGTAEYRMMKLKRSSSVRVSMCFGCAMGRLGFSFGVLAYVHDRGSPRLRTLFVSFVLPLRFTVFMLWLRILWRISLPAFL